MKALKILRDIPIWAYLAVALSGVVALHFAHDRANVAAAYAQGRKDLTNETKVDSVLRALVVKQHTDAVVKTDTVIKYVRVTAARADSQAKAAVVLAQSLPVVIDTFPQVRELKAAVFEMAVTTTALRTSVDSLTRAFDTERAAARLALNVSDAQVAAARIETIKANDRITVLSKRPTWGTVLKVGAVLGGIGVAVGTFIIH